MRPFICTHTQASDENTSHIREFLVSVIVSPDAPLGAVRVCGLRAFNGTYINYDSVL